MVENPNRKVEKLLPEERLGGNGLFARITVFPGREIDYHEHHGETETYHIIAGEGVYGDNGAERAIYAETGSLTDRKKPAKSYDFADFLEVTPRFELGNEGFADPCLTTWLCHRIRENGELTPFSLFLERATRLELATSTLARSRSTR